MEITEYTVEEIIDPTGLIEGKRFEFHIFAMMDEEDELYTENGIGIRTILAVEDGEERLVVAHFFDRATDEVYNFELEDDEKEMLLAFCVENVDEE